MRGRELGLAVAIGAVLLTVTGCDTTVQEQLGIGKRTPDEFQVVRRAPLIIPPDVNLRPPQPGAPAVAQPDPSAEARNVLTGESESPAAGSLSPGEQALLAESPVKAEPGIRGRIASENVELAQLDRRTFLWILNFQKQQFQPANEVLNPAAEAARLKAATQPGSVVTVRTGSTPIASP